MSGNETDKIKATVYVAAITAALAGLLFGLDIGVISGALQDITRHFQLSTAESEWVVSSILAGAVVGTLLSGFISVRYGRKNALMVSAVVFMLGALGSATASSVEVLITVRFFLGIGIGIASFTAPLYLSEMAPQRIRGALISMYQLMITIGIVLAFISDTTLSEGGHWRWMLGVLAIPAGMMLLGVISLPKSPRWLAMQGRNDESRQVLMRLRSSEQEVNEELRSIDASLKVKKGSFDLLKNRNFRRVLALGIGLQVMQQLTGINIMMYYAPQILKATGFASTQDQMYGTILIGVVNVLATFIAIGFVDRFGRRPILLIGFIVMGISLAAVGTFMYLSSGVATGHGAMQVYHWVVHLGQLVEPAGTTDVATLHILTVAFLLLFIVGFAMSAGPIVWVLCSEIYPLAGRDLGITFSTTTNWVVNMLVGATFLTLLKDFGHAQTFWLFGAFNIIFIYVTLRYVPETKGVSLERIEENVMSGKPLAQIGNA